MTNEWKDLLAELYADPELMARFKKNPIDVMRQQGFIILPGIRYEVLEDTGTLRHLVIPYLDPKGGINVEKIESKTSKVIL